MNKILIETDIGQDPDDFFALLYLISADTDIKEFSEERRKRLRLLKKEDVVTYPKASLGVSLLFLYDSCYIIRHIPLTL